MMDRRMIVAAAAAIALNGFVLADMGTSDQGGAGSSGQQSQTGQMGQSGSPTADSGQSQLTDQQFVKQASSANNFEIQLSQIAADKLDDPQLKKMAKEMQKDHQKSQDRLSRIAEKNDMKVSSGVSDPQQKQMLQDIKNKSGADFQQAFLQDETHAHQQTIDLFQRAQTQVENQDLKAYAQKTLPTLQSHLTMIKEHQGGAQPAGSSIPGSDQNQQNQPSDQPKQPVQPQQQQDQPQQNP